MKTTTISNVVFDRIHLKMRTLNLIISLCFLLILNLQATELFSVTDVFSSGMVLQRNAKINVWGNAPTGSEISIELNGKTTLTKSKDDKWLATLAPLNSGGPYELKINCKGKEIILDDILIGDVWLAGGQSNMEFPLRRVDGALEEIQKAYFPQIRYYKAPRKIYAAQVIENSTWLKCSPSTAGEMSAIAYYFARNIQQEINVPIGIIQTPFGGTTAEAWMSKEKLLSKKDFKPIIERYDSVINSYYTNEYNLLYADFQHKTVVYNDSIKNGFKIAEKPIEPMGEKNFRRPFTLFENMLKPLMPFTLKGIIFYQGESNTGRGYQYRKLFPAMIAEWRKGFQQGNLPFLFVQLPKFDTKTREWAELREAQLFTSKKVKNAGMVVAFDQGNPKDIHPTVKKMVAHRLTQLALGKVYAKNIVYSGPHFKSMKKKGNQIELTFNNTGTGIVTSDGNTQVKAFEICGKNGVFYAADAKIANDKIIVSSKKVTEPMQVRYAWTNSTEINLFNNEGFPASPFRTDNFKLKTFNIK